MSDSNIKIKKSFTGRSDQKSILESMIKLLKYKYPQYNDMTENDLMYMIFEAVSFAVSGLNYRSDKNYLGLNPKTADTESQKANIISSYGGSLDFFRGSYGYVKAYLKENFEMYSTIKKYTEVKYESSENKYKYYIHKDVVVNDENIKTEPVTMKKYLLIPIRQGEVKRATYSKNSVIDDRMVIHEKDTQESGIAFESIQIENQGRWTQKEDVFFEYADPRLGASQSRLYSLTKDLDRLPIVQFITGWQDLVSEFRTDSFDVVYAVSVGNKASISSGVEVKIDNPNIERAVTLGTVKGGYTPSYDLTVQVNKAIQESRTMWTAITIEDFRILSKEHPDVMASRAYDIDDSKLEKINQYLRDKSLEEIKPLEVAVSFVGHDSQVPNQYMIDEVMGILNDRKLNIFDLRYIEPTIININYDVTITTIGETIIVTKDEIKKIINKLYSNVDRFGTLPVSNSKIVASLQNISENIYSVEVDRNESGTISPFSFSNVGEITLKTKVV